jgi:DNA-binding LacI/PurR family transcriptional regulator
MPASSTLRDVRLCGYVGISKSTVRHVLTGVGSASAEAHKQIMDAATKLGALLESDIQR